jgi:hypothetical protein
MVTLLAVNPDMQNRWQCKEYLEAGCQDKKSAQYSPLTNNKARPHKRNNRSKKPNTKKERVLNAAQSNQQGERDRKKENNWCELLHDV